MNTTKIQPKVGGVYEIRGRRGTVTGTVVSTRRVQRGRFAGMTEYTLAPMEDMGKVFGFTAIGESLFLRDVTEKFKQGQVKAAGGELHTRKAEKEKVIADKADAGYEAITTTDVSVGDEVLIGYRNGTYWEKVIKINYRTGKIGIEREDADRRKARNAKREQDGMGLYLVAGIKPKKERLVRWIPATLIKEVKKGGNK